MKLQVRWLLSRTGTKWHGTRDGRLTARPETLCGRTLIAPRRVEEVLPPEAIHRLEVCAVCWRNRQ